MINQQLYSLNPHLSLYEIKRIPLEHIKWGFHGILFQPNARKSLIGQFLDFPMEFHASKGIQFQLCWVLTPEVTSFNLRLFHHCLRLKENNLLIFFTSCCPIIDLFLFINVCHSWWWVAHQTYSYCNLSYVPYILLRPCYTFGPLEKS